MLDELREELRAVAQAGLYRRPRTLDAGGTPEVLRKGRRYLNFCSNDYLGLAGHRGLANALAGTAAYLGVGSGAAHLITGHRHAHQVLEEELADWLGYERVLLFSTGYMANLGVVDALLRRGDLAAQDRLNHASLLDAGRLSGARSLRYRHNDVDDLRTRLRGDYRRRLVITDGVFSMDGDQAPLPELAEAAAEHGAWLMVDDAHGVGVVGPQGRGTVAEQGLGQAQVPVLVGTLGKAFGCFGAFVAGPEALIELLIQKARTYVYTTAPPPAMAAATRAALHLVRTEDWRRVRLRELIARFRRGAESLGLRLMPSTTPIQPLLIGDARPALAASRALEEAGVLVTAIRPPTVPPDTARLRITFSAVHEPEHVDRLLDALARVPELR